MTEVRLRPLRPDDASLWRTLRLAGLREAPRAFLASEEEDAKIPLVELKKRFRAPHDRSVVFGAFEEDALVGMVGLHRPPTKKRQHRFVLWGMYVPPSHRRRGLGRRLLEQALAHARATSGVDQVVLCVETGNDAARTLYEALGFACWAVETDAFRVDGSPCDEAHYVHTL